ncbi:MAG: right-handed parallel beta-helix repeat-containing protein [Phycisphaerales bacterium]|nr:right-handed parallel beta-helix repeat-containing protein [Phycisphaerales bacterium]
MSQWAMAALLAVFAGAASSMADTIHVPAEAPTISDAVATAGPGDTILIAAGTYTESGIFIDDPDITMIGEVNSDGTPAVTLDGQGTNDILLAIGLVNATGATIENLRFTGSIGNAVWIYHHSPTIRNCLFTGNSTVFAGGAIWSSDTQAVIESCQFIGNTAGDNGSLVLAKGTTGTRGHAGPVFRDCLFQDNDGYCTLMVQFHDADVENCDFRGNSGHSAIYVHSSTLDVSGSLFCENGGAPITGPYDDGGDNTFTDTCPVDCMGDLNGDLLIDIDDLLFLLGAYQVNADGDCDDDGDTDVDDLLLLIGAYGQGCG